MSATLLRSSTLITDLYAPAVPSVSGLPVGRFVGIVAGAAPTGGPYLQGDYAVDRSAGAAGWWICVTAGSPGEWMFSGPGLPLAGGTLGGPLNLVGDALTALQPVTLQQEQADFAVYGHAFGADPRGFASSAVAVWPTTNRCIFVRNTGSTVSMDRISAYFAVGSGHCMVAVYADNGLKGVLAAPTGSPLGASGSIDVSAASTRTFLALGSKVTCHRGDWIAMMFDNVTVSIVRIATAQRMGDGLLWYQDPGSFALPDPVGSLSSSNYCPVLMGHD